MHRSDCSGYCLKMLEQAKPSVGFPLPLGVSWPLPAWRASVLSDCDVFAAPPAPTWARFWTASTILERAGYVEMIIIRYFTVFGFGSRPSSHLARILVWVTIMRIMLHGSTNSQKLPLLQRAGPDSVSDPPSSSTGTRCCWGVSGKPARQPKRAQYSVYALRVESET